MEGVELLAGLAVAVIGFNLGHGRMQLHAGDLRRRSA
jgi:hypothetical protein